MPPTRYEVFRSYRDRDRSKDAPARFLVGSFTRKRLAIRRANRSARFQPGPYPRRVSVYAVPPGKTRGTLVHQVHYNSKLQRLVVGEL